MERRQEISLGEEFNFSSLINSGNPAVDSRLKERKPQAILDIGSMSGEVLHLMYHSYPWPMHLEGIELLSESKVVAILKEHDQGTNPSIEYESLFQRYKAACLKTSGFVRPAVDTEAAYKKAFQVTYVGEFVWPTIRLDKYDMLILSNILHMYPIGFNQILIHELRYVKKEDALVYIHIKDKGGNTDFQELTDCCDELAELWQLRKIPGRPSSFEKRITYTNL